MAGVKISALPAVVTPALTDIMPEVQPAVGGTTYKVTLQQIADLFNVGVTLTNGQVLIGSTGLNPVPNTLTAGAGVTIVNGPGSITISSSGGGLAWSEITTATQAIAVNNGYIANRGGGVAFSLPVISAVGTVFSIVGKVGVWSITQGAGQQIHVGTTSTTAGVLGSLTAASATDSVTFVCIVANLEYQVVGGPQTAGFILA